MTCNIKLLVAAHLVASAAICGPVAYAQEVGAVPIEEVLVTARKRTESVQDVPTSIAVVSTDFIEKLGANNYTDLLGSVPSLTAYQNGPGRARLSIRGVANGAGNDNDTQNQETVGLYIDEIPVSAGAMNPELGLFDLERVEVLRGPQGTLYGAGSMTGTVRLITRRPQLDAFEGRVDAQMSTISKGSDGYSMKGLVNLPLIEGTLALRTSGYYTHTGGYIDNVATGKKDVNEGLARGGRMEGRWKINDNFYADLSVFHHDYEDKGRPEDLERVPGLGRDYVSSDGYADEMQIYNLTLNYELAGADLVSSTSYFDRETVNKRSLDTLLALFPVNPHPLVDTTDLDFFAQEIRLASRGDGPFSWIFGGYADKKDVYYLNTVPVPGFDSAMGIDSNDFGAPTDFPYYGFDDLVVKTWALFGEASYRLGPMTVTAGVRWFNWKQDYKLYASGFLNGATPADPPKRNSSEDGMNPKLNVSYDVTEDVMLYAQAARGFRYGGINSPVPEDVCAAELDEFSRSGGNPNVFDADKAWTYELGLKGAFAENRVTLTAAVFRVKWDDMQTQRALDCGFGFRENVGKALSDGVEVELAARPFSGMSLTLGGAYIDSRLDGDVANLNASKGDPAPFVPKLSYNASAEYSFPLGTELTGFVWGNVQYVGERNTQFDHGAARNRRMESYEVANLRTGVLWGDVELSVFVNNLLDSDGVIRALALTPFDPEARIRVQPRTIGIGARIDF